MSNSNIAVGISFINDVFTCLSSWLSAPVIGLSSCKERQIRGVIKLPKLAPVQYIDILKLPQPLDLLWNIYISEHDEKGNESR